MVKIGIVVSNMANTAGWGFEAPVDDAGPPRTTLEKGDNFGRQARGDNWSYLAPMADSLTAVQPISNAVAMLDPEKRALGAWTICDAIGPSSA